MYCPIISACIFFHLIVHKTASAEFDVKEWKKGCGKEKWCLVHKSSTDNPPDNYTQVLKAAEIKDSCEMGLSARRSTGNNISLSIFSTTTTASDVVLSIPERGEFKGIRLKCETKVGAAFYCEEDYPDTVLDNVQGYTLKSGQLEGWNLLSLMNQIKSICSIFAYQIEDKNVADCLAKIRVDEEPEKMSFDCGEKGYRLEFKTGTVWNKAKDSKITCYVGHWSTDIWGQAPTMRCIKYFGANYTDHPAPSYSGETNGAYGIYAAILFGWIVLPRAFCHCAEIVFNGPVWFFRPESTQFTLY